MPYLIASRSDTYMNKPLLSICIPTYNRAHYLRECLDSIVCQFDDATVYKQVEVIVSDNASEDDTGNLVREYQEKFGNIHYYRNEKNVLFDLNVVNAVEKASGTYCWYMGDDDAICSGGIKLIVDFLIANDVAIVTVDTIPFVPGKNITKKEIELVGDPFIKFNDFHDFFKKGNCVGILSVFIFNRDLWLATIDKKNYIFGWLYYETILKMMPGASLPFVYCKYPIVYVKQDCDWVANGGELGAFLNCKRLLKKLVGFGYKKEVADGAFDVTPRRLMVMLLRAKGHDLRCSLKNLALIHSEFRNDIIYFPLIILIYFTPNFLIKSIRDINKKFINIKL